MAVGRPQLLILRALGIGDLLTAVPALRALARAFPDHERVLAAPAALRPLVELIDCAPGVPAVHRLAVAGELSPLPPHVHRAEVAVNLHGRGPQSHRRLLATRPGRALWFETGAVPESRGSPRWLPGEHEVHRWCRMLVQSGVDCDPSWLGLPAPRGRAPDGATGATIIHPGASSPARRWPPERFAEVARAEMRRGHRVVLTGGREDVSVARQIARLAGLTRGAILAGQTSLSGLARIVAAAGRVICGDTGVAHLATAFGIPSVLLFGPISPAEWGPPPERPQHRALWIGHLGDPRGASAAGGLMRIPAAEVIRALDELPANAPIASEHD